MLTGCNLKPSEEAFDKDSSRLYTQMFKDGEQSDKVKEMHKEYMNKYESYNEEDLYTQLDNMYEALDGKGEPASKYQMAVMNILNNN